MKFNSSFTKVDETTACQAATNDFSVDPLPDPCVTSEPDSSPFIFFRVLHVFFFLLLQPTFVRCSRPSPEDSLLPPSPMTATSD